ncbi:glycosyltransferase family 2 protein [Evansella tamaricis]|uniref:Glycosyltransferase family 2 protein n=1 Tax=Evansella tamaricis TaxID=2069301 RepID=A0ABS6JLY7_9BACI|nr:glycosyltransferase family 2 protein [Evansella tamaricis]MBU9714689.1 glycosyltransferase family 2 protein [Evansella tamaricis]
MKVDVIIPAYNEEDMIGTTLTSLIAQSWINEIIVVDDGSSDNTFDIAKKYTNIVLKHHKNEGKGNAIITGLTHSKGEWVMLLDADLGESASDAIKLLEPIIKGRADMTIAIFPQQMEKGLGLVKKRAQRIILKKTGKHLEAPLSGQRVFHRNWIGKIINHGVVGYGLEIHLNLTFLLNGATIEEVHTSMKHRTTGKDIRGFYHRAKQWIELERTVWHFQ